MKCQEKMKVNKYTKQFLPQPLGGQKDQEYEKSIILK